MAHVSAEIPSALGAAGYTPICPAPGTYVLQK